jgi:L-lactate dehydrogenase (cytochrome)
VSQVSNCLRYDSDLSALLLTVDSNVGDLRQSVEKIKGTTGSSEPGRKMEPFGNTFSIHDPSLNWNDLKWLKEVADGVPIYLKGVSNIEVSLSRTVQPS